MSLSEPRTETGTDWEVRPLREEDLEQALQLWRDVFQKPRSMEHWLWRFRGTPYTDKVYATVAVTPEGRVVGHYTAMPVKINHHGRPFPGCQGMDAIVHPDYRGQNIFIQTERLCYERMAADGIKLTYGVPHYNSYPGFTRYMKWLHIVHLREFWSRIDWRESIERRIPIPPLARALNRAIAAWKRFRLDRFPKGWVKGLHVDPELHWSDTAPDAYDTLWARNRSYEVLSIWKDAEYFRWRYDRHPDLTFRYAFLKKGERIVAFTVVRIDEHDNVLLYEFMVDRRHIGLGRYFVNRLRHHFTGKGYGKLRFIGHDSGFFEFAFEGWDTVLFFPLAFCAKVFDAPEINERLQIPSNWKVTLGDLD